MLECGGLVDLDVSHEDVRACSLVKHGYGLQRSLLVSVMMSWLLRFVILGNRFELWGLVVEGLLSEKGGRGLWTVLDVDLKVLR